MALNREGALTTHQFSHPLLQARGVDSPRLHMNIACRPTNSKLLSIVFEPARLSDPSKAWVGVVAGRELQHTRWALAKCDVRKACPVRTDHQSCFAKNRDLLADWKRTRDDNAEAHTG